MSTAPNPELDPRFSEETAHPAAWPDVEAQLTGAESYWITTVRADGRPHVAPLVGLWHDGTFVFCTGDTEQKYRNLEHAPYVAVTTGASTWQAGTDVVVEGVARTVSGRQRLQELADAFLAKYGEAWRFEVSDDRFGHGAGSAVVFRVDPTKVLVFAKDPHGQTTFRF
jgi:nitroimidazol reductase NimA-like FMN-containing flavoprotein (pyridoxamine 5'-phosphate oxidase superfamily)